jgi:hypothetical protein
MWEPRRLTTLWAFTACYRDSFTFYLCKEFQLCYALDANNTRTFCRRCALQMKYIQVNIADLNIIRGADVWPLPRVSCSQWLSVALAFPADSLHAPVTQSLHLSVMLMFVFNLRYGRTDGQILTSLMCFWRKWNRSKGKQLQVWFYSPLANKLWTSSSRKN